MKRLPVGESDFRKIRVDNSLYVDKTAHIYQLIQGGKYYFLSHPRRFGKSLLMSTLSEFFLGQKDLFKGLWIYDKVEWGRHPVINLSFNGLDYQELSLDKALSIQLETIAQQYQIQLTASTAKTKFSELILALSKEGQVAVLIDEYDKPILDFLDDYQKAESNRVVLKNFFGTLKDNNIIKHLKLVLITGVSKFSKVSVFSELNNLTDLTDHPDFTTMLGMTQQELEENFSEHIEDLAKHLRISRSDLLVEIKRWYNGYTWDTKNYVYNPHSLLHLFHSRRFENFWFRSGTTSWLVKNLRLQKVKVQDLENKVVSASFFDKFSLENLDPIVLLYQTGYLTLKKIVERGSKRYYLGYPNYEVRSSFLENLLEEYAHKKTSDVGETIIRLEDTLLDNKLDTFIDLFKIIFADISNRLLKQYIEQDIPELWEAFYHSVIYITLNLIGTSTLIDAEVQTNKGYTDLVAETDDYVYVMEFKIGTASSAIAQIKQTKYYQKYQQSGKKIMLVGIGFSSTERNIDNWLVETL